jgi:hypothetical protein
MTTNHLKLTQAFDNHSTPAVWAVIPVLWTVFTKLALTMQTECCLFTRTYMSDKKNTVRCKCEKTIDRSWRLILHALLRSAFI